MNPFKSMCVAFALAGLLGAAWADGSKEPGRQIFQQRCQGCHGDSSIGPKLGGIFGAKAGTGSSGVHSRAAMESGIVWDRESLRSFLHDPQQAIPGTFMPAGPSDPVELEQLLDYVERLR
jgi:cytochrome c2